MRSLPVRRFNARLLVAAALCATPVVASAEPSLGGQRPAYLDRPLSDVPNAQAIVRRFWAPGLDEGYTPQGLAIAGGRVHMVGYGAVGCRLFSLSTLGETTATLDAPACRHGGGLAAIDRGRLVIVDTRAMFIVEGGAARARIALEEPLVGSFGDFDGTDLWIGSYVRSGFGRLWRIPLSALARSSISDADATATLTIPSRAQGMAFGAGGLWLTFSGSSFGRLARIDPKTGAEIASHDMPAGIEDIGVDSSGLIWAVSEAGAKKYLGWPTTYPLVFAIDPKLLK
jgi:hypothetical protein